LQAIESFAELGSGIHIAMQDLDIRGAGNLLGAEQSGFIADLGYETYQKILAQAITELKNEEFTELFTQKGTVTSHEENIAQFVDECNVDCDLHTYFPETYVPGSSERMMLYRELDGLTEEKQLQEFKQRMEDRFGPIPPEGEELLRIQPLRKTAKNLGIERIALRNQKMILYFVSNANSPYYMSSTFERILQFATTNYRRCKLEEKNGKRSMTLSHVPSVEAALTLLRTCLDFGELNE
jgi:transcription-repair coupling factor (superfamily II helicase)